MTRYMKNMEIYDETVEDFQPYIERLEWYLEMNGIDDMNHLY